MGELNRREDESKLEYIKRIVYGKLVDKTIDNDYSELAPLVFDKEYSSDVARRMFYGVRALLDVLDKEGFKNIEDDEILREIEEKKLELEKEKIRYQDQKREFKNLIRPQARFERLLEVIENSIKELNETHTFKHNPNFKIYNSKKEAVLMASDWHLDAVFKHYFGSYDLETAKKRIQELLDRVIKICNDNEVDIINLELLGDNINGGLHWSSKVNSEEDCVSQTMQLCEILSGFINELCNNFKEVKVYSVIGNHSRINMNKKDNQVGENLERFVPFYLKARLYDIPNLKLMTDANIDDGIIMFDVLNTKIIGVHGDLDKPSQIINDLSKMLKVFADEYHMGHLHHHYEKEEYDMEVIINGSLQGCDYYAKDIRKSGRAMQKLMLYDEDGKYCTYKIKFN